MTSLTMTIHICIYLYAEIKYYIKLILSYKLKYDDEVSIRAMDGGSGPAMNKYTMYIPISQLIFHCRNYVKGVELES